MRRIGTQAKIWSYPKLNSWTTVLFWVVKKDWNSQKYLILYIYTNYLFQEIYENKVKGIFKLLDNTGKMQSQTEANFLENTFANWPNSQILTIPKPQNIHQNSGFIIRHFVGDVFYNVVSTCKYH